MTSPGDPLSYPPGRPPPKQLIRIDRAPTSSDKWNVDIGDEWLDTSTNTFYKLSSLALNTATWNEISSPGFHLEDIIVDAGTSPVEPDASNEITMTGAQVASGTTSNVLRTNGTASGELTYEIQQSGSSSTENTDLNGACHFSDVDFTVTNGFVALKEEPPGTQWEEEDAAFDAENGIGYFTQNVITASLPSGEESGATILFTVTTSDVLTIEAATDDKIQIGDTVSAGTGSADSSATGDHLRLVFRKTDSPASGNGTWLAASVIGTWDVT